MITAVLTSERTADIHERPGFLRRVLLGAVERDYEARRVREPGGYEWLEANNREVSAAVLEAIKRAEAKARARPRFVGHIRKQ